jgi:hypothetical protein
VPGPPGVPDRPHRLSRRQERFIKAFGQELNSPELPWQEYPWQRRCKAVKEPGEFFYWGRCELRRGHLGDHALERGMEVLRWSTRFTA